MSGLDLGFGKDSSSSNQQGVWGLQAPYLQALYQMAFGQTGMQTGMGGPTGPGGVPDPAPVRPIPSPGHSGKGAIKQYEQQMAAWQQRNPNGQQAQTGGPVGPAPGGIQAGGGTPGNPLGPIGGYSANLANGLFQQANGMSPALSGQIGSLGADIGRFWQQQILPGIGNDAGAAGQYGGARQGIAQGMGAQGALDAFQRGATDLYANNWNNGADRANSLYNLGMAPYAAQFAPLQALGGLLGGPAVLGSGSSGGGWNAQFGLGGGGGGGGVVP